MGAGAAVQGAVRSIFPRGNIATAMGLSGDRGTDWNPYGTLRFPLSPIRGQSRPTQVEPSAPPSAGPGPLRTLSLRTAPNDPPNAMTPDQLLAQAWAARQAGDEVRARSLINQAITLHLEWAAEEVADAEEALQRAQFSRRLVMQSAVDRGWSYSRIARAVGLSPQRVNRMFASE